MYEVNGKTIILGQTIKKWCDMFKNDCTDIVYDYFVGLPTSITTDNFERVNEIIQMSQRVIYSIIVNEISETMRFMYLGS